MMAGDNGNLDDDHNGKGAARGNGDAAPESGEVHENGEIAVKSKEGVEEGEADVTIQLPPKEDPMVDYTDEFGRVRTMRQR